MAATDFLREQVLLRGTPEDELNPSHIFDRYHRALTATRNSEFNLSDGGTWLEVAWKLNDNEETRRASIDSRANATLGAVGVVVTLLLTIGASQADAFFPDGIAKVPVVALGAISAVYIAASVVFATRVLRPLTRHTVGPTEVLPSEFIQDKRRTYSEQVAAAAMEATIENYKINNRVNQFLRSSQTALRNAILSVLAVAAIAAGAALVEDSGDLSCELRLGDDDRDRVLLVCDE